MRNHLLHAAQNASVHCIALALIVLWSPPPPISAQERLAPPSWPHWRGPNRDNVVADTTMVAVPWNGRGPLKLWQSIPIPSYQQGGLASPVVADGRVYLFATPKITTPVPTRTFSEADLRTRLGVFPVSLPDDVASAVEKARLSQERAALQQNQVRSWATSTMQGILPDQTMRRQYGAFVMDRLSRGAAALPLDLIEKLKVLKDRRFESEQALSEWCEAAGIPVEHRAAILSAAPRTISTMEDAFFCLNADNGAVVWEKRFPGVLRTYGTSSTVSVAAGRLYAVGSGDTVYCLDAGTGQVVWTAKGLENECHSSVVVLNGLAIVQNGPLTAYNATTGEVVWSLREVSALNNTPVPWTVDGTTYLLCNGPSLLRCVDLSGKVLWSAPGGSFSTPAVSRDRCVVFTGRTLVAYRISAAGAQQMWQVSTSPDRGASPVIWQDRVFLAENGRLLCVEVETGKVVWDTQVNAWELGSAVIADGKLIAGGNNTLFIFSATSGQPNLLASVSLPLAPCVTPAIAGGRIYLRLNNGVACYDLTRPAS